MATGTDIGWNEVGQHVFINVLASGCGRYFAVVLDVHPPQTGLHRFPLPVNLCRRKPLHDQIGRIKNKHQTGMVDPTVDLGQQHAGLAHQVRLNLQAESEI